MPILGRPMQRSSSARPAAIVVALLAATLVARPSPVAADVPAPDGLRTLADGLPLGTFMTFMDTTEDGRYVVAAIQLEDVIEVWSWDLSAPDPITPVRVSQDLSSPNEVARVALTGDLVLFDVVGTTPRAVFVAPVDGSQSPELVRGSPNPGEDVFAWGVEGSTGWFVDDADADGPVRLRRRDVGLVANHQTAPVTTLSPATLTGGVGRVVATPDGSRLLFEASIDSVEDELWVVPIDGDASDAARVSQSVDPGQTFQTVQMSGDGARAIYLLYESITGGARFEVWSAPLDPGAGDPVLLIARQQDNGTFLEDMGLFGEDPSGTSVLANWRPHPTEPSDVILAPIGGPVGASTTLTPPAGVDVVFPAFDPGGHGPAWRGDGGVLAIGYTAAESRLLSYPPDGGTPVDIGSMTGSLASARGTTVVRSTAEGLVRTTATGGAPRTLLDPADIGAAHVQFGSTPVGQWLPFLGEDPVYETLGAVSRGGTVVGPFDLDAGFPSNGVATFDFRVSTPGTHALLRHEVDANSDGAGDHSRLVAMAIPPSAPRTLAGAAGDGVLDVTWQRPADGMAPDGYEVTATPTAGGAPVVVEVGASATSARVDVVNGATYDVTVLPYSDQAGPGVPATATDLLPLEAGVGRVFGAGRIETAVAASQENFAPGVPAVYLATAADFPDALAAGPAAARDGAPILLLPREEVPEVVADELRRLEPGRIFVLGGSAAVSNAVVAQLPDFTDGPVRRLAGDNRYETAAEVAATFDQADRVIVATGATFPDALAGGALAALGGDPILLVAPTVAPDAAVEQVERLAPQELLLLGGEAAITQDVEGQLVVLTDDVRRIEGTNRFATSAAIADEFPASVDLAYVATGTTFPDALAGTPVAALTGSPVVLVRPDSVPGEAADALARLTLRRIVVLGGPGAVADTVVSALVALLEG